eukprot:2972811-Heterocapsa_arctica.AAC.1
MLGPDASAEVRQQDVVEREDGARACGPRRHEEPRQRARDVDDVHRIQDDRSSLAIEEEGEAGED